MTFCRYFSFPGLLIIPSLHKTVDVLKKNCGAIKDLPRQIHQSAFGAYISLHPLSKFNCSFLGLCTDKMQTAIT